MKSQLLKPIELRLKKTRRNSPRLMPVGFVKVSSLQIQRKQSAQKAKQLVLIRSQKNLIKSQPNIMVSKQPLKKQPRQLLVKKLRLIRSGITATSQVSFEGLHIEIVILNFRSNHGRPQSQQSFITSGAMILIQSVNLLDVQLMHIRLRSQLRHLSDISL